MVEELIKGEPEAIADLVWVLGVVFALFMLLRNYLKKKKNEKEKKQEIE